MRVYEFSKQYNIPTKEIINTLQAAGFNIKSHMSIIDDEAIHLLKKTLSTLQESSKKNHTPDHMQHQRDIVKNNDKKEKNIERHEERNEEKIRSQLAPKEEKLKTEAEPASLKVFVQEMSVADL